MSIKRLTAMAGFISMEHCYGDCLPACYPIIHGGRQLLHSRELAAPMTMVASSFAVASAAAGDGSNLEVEGSTA